MTSPAFPLFKLKLNFLPTPRSLSLPMCESMVTMQKNFCCQLRHARTLASWSSASSSLPILITRTYCFPRLYLPFLCTS